MAANISNMMDAIARQSITNVLYIVGTLYAVDFCTKTSISRNSTLTGLNLSRRKRQHECEMVAYRLSSMCFTDLQTLLCFTDE